MATNQTGGARSLGSAIGTIKIDVSSLKSAQAEVLAFAKATTTALSGMNASLTNFAKVAQAATAVRVAELRKEAQEVNAAAKIEVAAINAKAKADTDATKIQLENMRQLRQQRGSGGGTSGGGQIGGSAAGQDYRFPTFIQFAAYPAGQLLSLAGAQGASAGVMGAGALAGLLDQFAIIGPQIRALGTRLQGLGGIFGALATGAAILAAPLGATAAGLASMLAVAAPVALVIGGVALALNNIAAAAEEARKKAEDYVNKQLELNQLIAGGATTGDIQQQINEAERKQKVDAATQVSLEDLRTRASGQRQLFAEAVSLPANDPTKPARIAYASELGREIAQELSDLTGGAVTSITQLDEAIKTITATVDEDQVALGLLNAQLNNLVVLENTRKQEMNDAAAAAVEEAQMRREIAQMSTQQLQQRLADNRAEVADIQQQSALVTGEQYDIFVDRLKYLDQEAGAVQAMLAVGAPLRDLIEYLGKAGELAANFNRQTERTQEDRAISAADALFDSIIDQARETEDFVRQRTLAIEDFNRELDRSEEDALRALQETIDDYNETELEAEQEHQDRLAKIIRDARISILEAANRLDARAVFEQQRRRNQAIEDETETAEDAREQRLEQFEEALADQEEQYERQRARRIEDFARQLQREDQERAIRAARAEQDYALQQYRQERNYALQDARRLEDYQRQVSQLASHYQILAGIQQSGQALIQFLWNSLFTGMATSIPRSGGGGGLLTRDSGGSGFAGQAYWIGRGAQPEMFIPSTNGTFVPNADRMGSTTVDMRGATFSFGDVGNYSRDDLMGIIDDGFRAFFNQGRAQMQRSVG